MDIRGDVAPGFEAVRDAFEDNFTDRGEVGAACCIYVNDRKVVDLWGGLADRKSGRPWEEDTPVLVYSTTKGVTAICVHRLAQDRVLDLDVPVASYWPEYAAAGKARTTVRHLLSHRAGLPVVDAHLTPEQALAWDPAVQALAAQAPLWEPGTRHGYHAVTFGWLVGEVVRRATGRSLGRYLAEEVAAPLGLDLWIGLPPEKEPLVARLLPAGPLKVSREELAAMPPEQLERLRAMAEKGSLMQRALNPTDPPLSFNRPAVHAAELPAANGIGTARSLARLYAATIGEVDGVRLLDEATLASATVEQSSGPDAVLAVDTRFGSGFLLPSPFSPLMGPRSFGHSGAGGSLTFADPDSGVAFAYVMNKMQQGLAADPRPAALVSAFGACFDR